ncbi:MAG: hypothetical protein ACI9D0_001527, partial [Bacteroidia bacterium]
NDSLGSGAIRIHRTFEPWTEAEMGTTQSIQKGQIDSAEWL